MTSISCRALAPGLILVVSLSAVLSACASKQAEPEPFTAETLVVFPPPPDTAKIQFLTRISSSTDITPTKKKSFWRSLVGEEEEADQGKPIGKPYGIAIHDGKIYVCDTMLAAIEVIDLRARTFDYFSPRGLGKFSKPIGCFVDKETGHLYVADVDRGQVVVFTAEGRYIAAFGEQEGARPTDVFVDGSYAWLCDIENGKVHVYDKSDYRHVAALPEAARGTPEGLFQPTNLFVTDDRLYVSDFGDFKIKIYSHEGEYVESIGSYGRALGQFTRPKGVAVDRESNLYVVDAAFQNVQMFDRDGRLLMFFGGGYQGPGYMWLPAKVIVDYDNVDLFQDYVYPGFELKHLVFVTNQFGPDKVTVYGFVEPKRDTAATR